PAAAPLRVRPRRDPRLARGGADALANAVGVDDRVDRRDARAGDDEAELADRGDRVADRRDRLVAGPGAGGDGGEVVVAHGRNRLWRALAIGGHAGEEAHEGGGALVDAVDDPELQRRRPEGEDHVDPQDARDHLRGDVREQAGGAEQEDGAPDVLAGAAPLAGLRLAAAQDDLRALDQVRHAQAAAASAGAAGTPGRPRRSEGSPATWSASRTPESPLTSRG